MPAVFYLTAACKKDAPNTSSITANEISITTSILQKDLVVRDPVITKEGDVFYLFSTGRGIKVFSSRDLTNWKAEKRVFDTTPDWVNRTISNFNHDIWAPDISYHNGKYYLFYAVSSFGTNNSAIGIATNETLDPLAKNYKWEDRGKILQSIPGETNWNAIDPNLIKDSLGDIYLSFGSFWEGLKIVKLKKDLSGIDGELQKATTIAGRKPVASSPVLRWSGDNAIEAPFIFRKGKFYYLFASIDYCCKGINSTYKIIVGRSERIDGPFVDESGKRMTEGGGNIVLKGNSSWYGVGHNSILSSEGSEYLVFHGYDASDNGMPKLRIEKITWDEDGWPRVNN